MEDLQNRSAQETRKARLHYTERLQAHRPPGCFRQTPFGVRQRNLGIPCGTEQHPTEEPIRRQKRAHHVEQSSTLPKSQYGGRKGRTATDAVHSLVEFTKLAWRRKKEVVILFLDIKGAFPNVAIPVLTHDMRNMGFHPKFTNWITNKTTDRETVLVFDDFISPPFRVRHGHTDWTKAA